LRGQVSGGERVAERVHAAVETEHDVRNFGAIEGNVRSTDATAHAHGRPHFGWQRVRRRPVEQQPPLLLDIGVGGEGRPAQSRMAVHPLLRAHRHDSRAALTFPMMPSWVKMIVPEG
jgi:hypothetical protein